jgi:ATP-dependent exoDNAse (exonuclease V) beta subunit
LAKLLPFLPLFEELDGATPVESSASFQPPDAAARAQALDIRRSFIVEAPAGSGKTGLLIQRFLKLLADDSVTTPEQVLAITFTLKATAEMRDRVLGHLIAATQSADQPAVISQLAAGADASPAPDSEDFLGETRALAQAVLQRDRRLGWGLLDHPQRLNIRTIDSVCAEIARALPVLSGSGGRLAPVEDSGPLHREAARRTLLLLGGADAELDAALRTLLLHRGGNLAQCESLLAEMLSVRDQWGDLIELNRAHLDDAWLDEHVLPRLERALERAICATLSEVERAFPPDLLAELSALAAEMAHTDGYNGEPSPIASCIGRSEPPEAVAEHLDRWRSLIHLLVKPSTPKGWRKGVTRNVVKFEIEKRHEAQLKSIIARLSAVPGLLDLLCKADSLPPARYPENQWAVAKALFRVLNRALVELQLVFAERNQCDFTELNLLARQALRHDGGADDLAAALGARLQHLLVDEMQDTSTSQYALLELLTQSWDGHSQTVFLVGDPRQSIYLFRQARVERFVSAMISRRLGDLPLTPLRLTANFRSQSDLVDWFNADFPLVFTGPDANALPYEPVQPTLPASPAADGAVWHINPIAGAQTQQDPPTAPTQAQIRQQQARHDAREIRRIAQQWIARPLPADRKAIRDELGEMAPTPWRIAVLVRSRTHLVEIAAEFKKEAIPFRAVEIEQLSERQEVLDLTALTRALLHPADRVALLAVLRAPWCGLTLADLHTLTGSGDSTLKEHSIQRLIAERGHLLPDDSIQRLTRVWSVLQSLAAQRARLTTAKLVERAWRSLGGDAWLGRTQLTNAQRFFELLDALQAESPDARIEPSILKHRLEKLYAEPEVFPVGTPFVELLTIHKAKGLEWDVVFVPALERPPAIGSARLLAWSEIGSPESGEDAAHIMLAPIRGVGEEPEPLNAWLYRLQKAREAAEEKRLFYVACTRAREELHLFAAPAISVKGKPSPGRDSLLKAALPAAQQHIARVLGAISTFDSEDEAGDGEPTSGYTPPPEPLVLDLAAATDGYHETIQRLPPDFDPAARFTAARARKLAYAEAEQASPAAVAFARPEGSFAARSFGNAVHAFLEVVANRLASSTPAAALLAEIPARTTRIAAVLRADGLPPSTVDRLTRDTRAALQNTLHDPLGLWLLAPHAGAASELGLTAWLDTPGEPAHAASIRVDRVFYAGPEPHASGEDVLWVVDYKTADHGPSGLDGFLAAQRTAYAPQLETYARILTHIVPASAPPPEVRVALYYPAIPCLIWWNPLAPQPTTRN